MARRRRSARRALAFLAACAACAAFAASGCGKSEPATATGATVFAWDHTKATRAGVAAAIVGSRAGKDHLIKVAPKDAPGFAVALHVEVADVSFAEGTESARQTSPVVLRATVKENDGWNVTGKCLEGPHYQMPALGEDGKLVTPRGMLQECQISYKRRSGLVFSSSWDLALSVSVRGDGVVAVSPEIDVTVD